MALSTGYYRPGRAGGEHSGYPGRGSMYRGGGFLGKLGKYREQMAKLQLKMMEENIKAARDARRQASYHRPMPYRREVSPAVELFNLQKADRDARAKKMADALYNHPRGAARTDPFGRSTLTNMLLAIGPDAAHEGMMQSGQLFAGQRGTPMTSRPSETEAMANLPTGSMDPFSAAEFIPELQTEGKDFGPTYGKGVWTGYRKGTLPGTVPKTEKALVHKGEIILSEPQSRDPSLVAALIEDARMKGIPMGKGKNKKGYGCGSLKAYQAGTLGEPAAADEALRQFQELRGRTVGGMQPMIPGLEGTAEGLPSRWPGVLQDMATPSGPGAPFPSGQMDLPLQAAIDAAEARDKEILRKAAKNFAYGTVGDDALKAAAKTAPGKRLLLAAGGAALLMSALTLSAGRKKDKKGQLENLEKALTGRQYIVGPTPETKAGEPTKVPRWLHPKGEMRLPTEAEAVAFIEEQKPGELEPIEDAILGTFSHTPQTEAGAQRTLRDPRKMAFADPDVGLDEAQRAFMEGRGGEYSIQPEAEEAPMEPYSGTGSKEDPYTMTGELSPGEKSYRQMRGDPGYREAKHRADMAQNRVTKILNLLESRGDRMAPNLKKNLMESLALHSKRAGEWQKRVRDQEKSTEDLLKYMEAARVAVAKERDKQDQITDRTLARIEAQKTKDKEMLFLRNSVDMMSDLYDDWLNNPKASRRNAIETELLEMVQTVAQAERGERLPADEAIRRVKFMVHSNDPEMFRLMASELSKGVGGPE